MTGRALFSVEKGSTFQVKTDEGAVTVLGTIFDVKQRKAGVLAVNCYEGLVRVDIQTIEERLSAGQGLISRNAEVTRLSVGLDKPGWVEQRSNYTDAPLASVIQDLQDFHGVEIILPAASNNEKFTGLLNYSDLNKALKQLGDMFELTYTQEGDKVVFE